MDPTLGDTIDRNGDPLAFRVRQGVGSGLLMKLGRDTIKVEARQMTGHQKEAVVGEGAEGAVWRLTSDEGAHLKGHDLAPFPLGYFNVGLQADLYGRIRSIAAARNLALDGVAVRVVNHYWLTGSFIHGTGEGHADAPDIDVELQSAAPTDAIEALVAAAAAASPVIAYLRAPLTGNTFALYINGRRRQVEGVANSDSPDVQDPYRVYASAPRPLDANARRDLVTKTGRREQGSSDPLPATVPGKLVRNIFGSGHSVGRDGLYQADTYIGIPGASHYALIADEGPSGVAPWGLTYASAGIAFCYMTQLSRYIENMNMNIRGVRLVQFNSYLRDPTAEAMPIDTHLFLNGEAPDETHLQLLTIAARTCYLHAAARTPTEPKLRIVHNGRAVARAA